MLIGLCILLGIRAWHEVPRAVERHDTELVGTGVVLEGTDVHGATFRPSPETVSILVVPADASRDSDYKRLADRLVSISAGRFVVLRVGGTGQTELIGVRTLTRVTRSLATAIARAQTQGRLCVLQNRDHWLVAGTVPKNVSAVSAATIFTAFM